MRRERKRERKREREREREKERERKRESGLASTCCTPLSVSNPLVRRFQPLSSWTHVGLTWDVGAHCVHTNTVGAELPRGQRSGHTFDGGEGSDRGCARAAGHGRHSQGGRDHSLEAHLGAYPARHRLQEENVEVIQRSVEEIISQEHIPERTQVVDATVPQIMEELQERISERMHEQVVDVPVPMTVHQPGDQACRVPAESIH